MRTRTACLLLGLLAAACGKTGSLGGDPPPTAVAGSGSTSGGSGPVTQPPLETACNDEELGPGPGASPLSRLDNFELNRSLRAVLGDFPSNVQWLSEESYGPSFESGDQPAPDAAYHALVHDLAQRFSLDAEAVRNVSLCDAATSGEATCRQQFLERLLARAFRRATTDEDIAELGTVFDEGERLGGDFASGVRAAVEVTLHDPEFLYLLQLGSGKASGKAVALTGFESAARLAYFLTAAPPDDQLLAVASKGAMSAEDLESEARRLLGTAPSRELLRHFYTELLGLGWQRESPELGYTTEVARFALEAAGRFVEDVTFDGAGTYQALMTEPSAWVNGSLAPFYGIAGVTGDDFQKVMLDPQQRGGLFTQIGFLANTSHGLEPNAMHRASLVLRRTICYDSPPPPPNVDITVPDPVGGTLRQRLSAMTESVACQSCHKDLNPIGFAFQNYDGVGKWREAEPEGPVDASGTLFRSDAQGDFANALDLLQRIAQSDDGKACLASQWLTQAYRRVGATDDACAQQQVTQAFAESDGNLVELLVTLAKTDNFRFRLKSELAP